MRVDESDELAYDWTACPQMWRTKQRPQTRTRRDVACECTESGRGGASGEHVHVAVVGYGYWGSKHVRVLSTMPDVAVTVVDSDVRPAAEAAAHYPRGEATATDLDEVLDGVDAVSGRHATGEPRRVALEALTAGKHVLVEKPLATSVEDAEALVRGRGGQRRAPDGRPHLRVQRRRLEAEGDHPLRRAGPGALHRHGPAQPRPLPARRERHLGPGAARHLDHLVPPRTRCRSRPRCGRIATSADGARTSPTSAWTSRAGPTPSCT